MYSHEQQRLERITEQLDVNHDLVQLLQRMSRNKRNSDEIRNSARKEADATRAEIQSLIDQRDQAQETASTERDCASDGIAKTTEKTILTGGMV